MDINAIIGVVFQMKRVSAVNRECALTARQKAVQLIEIIKRQYNVKDFALNKKTTANNQ